MPISQFSNSLKSIKRKTISAEILNMITDSILAGDLKPGEKLPTETELAESLGVGRNSVREAVKMLLSLGVVEVRRGAGTFIATSMNGAILDPLLLSLAIEQGASRDLADLRLMIEIGTAKLVIEQAKDEDILRLEKANEELKKAAEKSITDSTYLRETDLNIHYTLFDITGNRFIAKIGKAIYRMFMASIEKTVEIDPYKAYLNHKLYIDAIKARDRASVGSKIREALAEWVEYVNK
jgi:GntR family transcriptional regulator, transcriptional repressor for pyruvate dehydrogenase complex